MDKITKGKLREIRELLRDKRVRDEKNIFVIEGSKIIKDVIKNGHIPEFVISPRDHFEGTDGQSFLLELESRNISVFASTEKEIEKISSLRHSSGMLAVIEKPRARELKDFVKKRLLVLSDSIQDPGNLGTMIRTLVSFEADGMLISGETADIYNPKVVRASSGTVMDLPVCNCGPLDLDDLKENGYRLMVSCPPGQKRKSIDVSELNSRTSPCILAFGSEGKGVSTEVLKKADEFFHIPIGPGVESLNVSAAAAITMYVFTR